MNILHMVTWYTEYGSEVLKAGVFHYEQVKFQGTMCKTAIYFPFDRTINNKFQCEEEYGILTFRTHAVGSKILRYVEYIKDFKQIIVTFKPDIIHAHVGLGAGKLAVFLGKLFHVPVIITEHNPLELMNLDNKKNKRILQQIYKLSKFNICVSPNQEKRLREEFKSIDFITLCNGVENPIKLIEKDFKLKKYSEHNCCIVASFYDKEIKGYQFLIPAIKKLVEDGYNISLHICGGGDFFDYYKNLVRELDIENNIIFYGACKKSVVYSVINQSDFLISASIFESAGVSVEEALLLGKPVLVTKSGGANSLVTEDNAIIIEKGSVDSLVVGIKKMMEGNLVFDSEKIKSYAMEKFDIEKVNNKICNIYKKIVDEKR